MLRTDIATGNTNCSSKIRIHRPEVTSNYVIVSIIAQPCLKYPRTKCQFIILWPGHALYKRLVDRVVTVILRKLWMLLLRMGNFHQTPIRFAYCVNNQDEIIMLHYMLRWSPRISFLCLLQTTRFPYEDHRVHALSQFSPISHETSC